VNTRLHRLLLFLFLTSCATGSKRLAAIDSALADVQNGKSEQGRAALDKVCESGATGACALLGRQVSAIRPVSILQSVTSNSQSRFVIVLPHHEKLNYYVKHGDALNRLEPEHFERSGMSSTVDQVEAFNLEPSKAYDLIVVSSDGMLWDKRSFKTLDLKRKRARIAVISALDDSLKVEQLKMWTQLLNQRPDAILLLGDSVFPEKGDAFTGAATPDLLWRSYAESRDSLALFHSPVLVPVLALWNDHDYGRNDGDRTYPYKNDSAEIFLTFYAQRKPAPAFERGPGLSAWWNAFGVHFALLDNRSYRSPDGLDVSDQTHFGVDQEKWLEEHMKSAAEPVFLASGDQFFGGYHHLESYEGNHPKRFLTALEGWKKDPEPVLFLSGDRRLSEIIKVPAPRLGYTTYELTSSGLHANVPQGAFQENPSPNQLAGADGVLNYMMVELIRSERNFIQLDVQAFGPDKKQLYQKILTVKHL
jgi:alkaline phosphatase D